MRTLSSGELIELSIARFSTYRSTSQYTLRLPAGSSIPNTIFLNMNLQSTIICLHQAATFKAEKQASAAGDTIASESKARCFAAAMQIASIMKKIAHIDLSMVVLSILTTFITSIPDLAGKLLTNMETEDSEWITFVSPLVRIVEQTEEGSPAVAMSQSFRGGSSSASSDVAKGKMPATVRIQMEKTITEETES
ncbi:hypothetical protein EG329_006174 [Mollisiaceae sp. DMI_Dod_QoI]|nr:hypothetical protein EG329_006174 [Helotiales sp. DMI_Dod_QoI]